MSRAAKDQEAAAAFVRVLPEYQSLVKRLKDSLFLLGEDLAIAREFETRAADCAARLTLREKP